MRTLQLLARSKLATCSSSVRPQQRSKGARVLSGSLGSNWQGGWARLPQQIKIAAGAKTGSAIPLRDTINTALRCQQIIPLSRRCGCWRWLRGLRAIGPLGNQCQHPVNNAICAMHLWPDRAAQSQLPISAISARPPVPIPSLSVFSSSHIPTQTQASTATLSLPSAQGSGSCSTSF